MYFNKRDKILRIFVDNISKSHIMHIWVFGSTAIKNDRPDSDIDIAIVYTLGWTNTFQKHIEDIRTNLMIDYGIHLSLLYFKISDWHQNIVPIIHTIKHEGIKLWENVKIPLSSLKAT